MPSNIRILCGKGGVGKTTISLAMAIRDAAQGRRVLVITSHPLSELSAAVSLEGLGAQYPGAAKNLFLVHLDPRELLAEAVQRHFPVTASADQSVRNAILRNVVEVAPGLKSVSFVSRLQQLAERKSAEGDPQYQTVIWDAPASHALLAILRGARAFDPQRGGPLGEAAQDAARFFAGSPQAIPVATLDEMAIEEAVDLAAVLAGEFGWRGPGVLLNMVSPVQDLEEPADDPALDFVLRRARVERERAASLGSRVGIAGLAIPRLIHSGSDLALLGQIGGFLEASAAA